MRYSPPLPQPSGPPSMLGFLRNLLGAKTAASPFPEVEKRPEYNAKLRRLQELDEIDAAVRKIIAISPEKMESRLFILSLDNYRTRFGNTWGYVGEKAIKTAKAALREKLNSADIMAPVNDGIDYIIMVGSGPKREAVATAFRIDQSIMFAVTGEDLGPLGVSSKEVIYDAASDSISFRPLSYLDLQRGTKVETKTQIDLESELAGEDDDEEDAFPTADAIVEKIRFEPRPVMELDRGVLAMHRLTPLSSMFGEGSSGRDLLGGFDDPKLRAKLDLRALRSARELVKDLFSRMATEAILIPVGFETLANVYTRGLLVKLAQRYPVPVRKFLVFELTDIPNGLAQGRFSEIVGILKPFGSGTMLRLPVEFKEFRDISDIGATGVICDTAFSPSDEMMAFCEAAKMQRFRLCVGGIADRGAAQSARSMGFDLGYGPAFGNS